MTAIKKQASIMDGPGSLSPSELEAMRNLAEQRLPIQSKHVESLLASVASIEAEAFCRGLEEAARLVNDEACIYAGLREGSILDVVSRHIRSLKDKGE